MAEMNKVHLALKVALSLITIVLLHCCEGELILRTYMHVYCSEDGDETNAPMTAINIPSKGKTWPFHAIFNNVIP